MFHWILDFHTLIVNKQVTFCTNLIFSFHMNVLSVNIENTAFPHYIYVCVCVLLYQTQRKRLIIPGCAKLRVQIKYHTLSIYYKLSE